METDPTEPSEERVPCTDDLCTGVLDSEGVCGTCGRAANGLPAEPLSQPVVADAAVHPADPDPVAADDASEREPCADEMCTGIVGADGRCGTCGKPRAA